jgi:hypothetical protein
MSQSDAWLMIRRRSKAAVIDAPICNHTFRATGITACLANGGALDHAQEMAAHENPRTKGFQGRDASAWTGLGRLALSFPQPHPSFMIGRGNASHRMK